MLPLNRRLLSKTPVIIIPRRSGAQRNVPPLEGDARYRCLLFAIYQLVSPPVRVEVMKYNAHRRISYRAVAGDRGTKKMQTKKICRLVASRRHRPALAPLPLYREGTDTTV